MADLWSAIRLPNRRRRSLTIVGTLAAALLLAGCGGDDEQEDVADVEPDATEAAEADEPDDAEGGGAEEPAEDEEDPFEQFQSDIEIPPEVTDLIDLPEGFAPDTLLADVENESAGALETSIGGDVPGDPVDLVAEIDDAVAAGDLGVVVTRPLP